MLPVREILDYYDTMIIADNPDNENIYCKCPMHESSGRTPQNFSINRYNGLWRCFSRDQCGDGNIIKFIMNMEECSNTEAKALLKKEFKAGEVSWKSVLKSCVKDKKTLNKSPVPASGKIPRLEPIPSNHPWIKSRDYTSPICRSFHMHYAPSNLAWVWWAVMFRNKLVGWSSRHVKKDARKKWWHQPGLPKSEILYNFDMAIRSGVVIVCEGILDVMRLKTLGYAGAVAIMGAKASDEQVALLVGNWDRIIVCLDGDVEGRDGAEKLCAKLKLSNLKLLTKVTMPEDVDVDDMRGKEEFIAHCSVGEVLHKKKVAPSWGDLLKSRK